jgi:hypothetical protein
MCRVAGLDDLSIEAVVLIGSVLDSTGCAVGFHQAILTLNDISVSLLGLLLNVACMLVIDSVLELILGVRLQRAKQDRDFLTYTNLSKY